MDREEPRLFEDLEREMKALEGRDLQLWSISLLVILIVAGGFVAIIFPNVMWKLGTLRLDGRYVPQLFFGFIALILLFNIYAVQQRRALHHLRAELLREFVRAEAAEKLTLVDPLTEMFNRRYLDQIISSEVGRADRRGTSLTFLMMDVDEFRSVNTRLGHLVGDRILSEVGKLLRETFRRSDTVLRYGGDEFMVVMPETNEQQAEPAIERLLARVAYWNRQETLPGFRLRLSCGLATYTKGADVKEVLDTADQRLYLYKTTQQAAR